MIIDGVVRMLLLAIRQGPFTKMVSKVKSPKHADIERKEARRGTERKSERARERESVCV